MYCVLLSWRNFTKDSKLFIENPANVIDFQSLKRNVLLLYPASKSVCTTASFQVLSEMYTGEINIDVHDIDITFSDIHKADDLIKERVQKISPIFQQSIEK